MGKKQWESPTSGPADPSDPSDPSLRKGLAVVPVVLPVATGMGLVGIQLSQDLSQDPHVVDADLSEIPAQYGPVYGPMSL